MWNWSMCIGKIKPHYIDSEFPDNTGTVNFYIYIYISCLFPGYYQLEPYGQNLRLASSLSHYHQTWLSGLGALVNLSLGELVSLTYY